MTDLDAQWAAMRAKESRYRLREDDVRRTVARQVEAMEPMLERMRENRRWNYYAMLGQLSPIPKLPWWKVAP